MKQFFKLAFKKKTFILIPILMLLITSFLYIYPQKSNTNILAGFFVADNDDGNICFNRFIDRLISYDGNISFIQYDSMEDLKNAVMRLELECGYVLTNEIVKAMDNGKYKNKIKVYTNRLTTTDNVVNQVLFSQLFHEYAFHQLNIYIENADELNDIDHEKINNMLSEAYLSYSTTDATFSFNISGNDTYEIHAKNVLSAPFIGVLSIMVMLSAFSGYITYLNYDKAHCFDKMIYKEKKKNMLKFITPYITLPGVVFMGCTFFLYNKGLIRSLISLTLFLIILYLLYYIIYSMKISRKIVLAILPAYITLCLIFSPIIIDITDFIKFLKPVKYIIITNLFY